MCWSQAIRASGFSMFFVREVPAEPFEGLDQPLEVLLAQLRQLAGRRRHFGGGIRLVLGLRPAGDALVPTPRGAPTLSRRRMGRLWRRWGDRGWQRSRSDRLGSVVETSRQSLQFHVTISDSCLFLSYIYGIPPYNRAPARAPSRTRLTRRTDTHISQIKFFATVCVRESDRKRGNILGNIIYGIPSRPHARNRHASADSAPRLRLARPACSERASAAAHRTPGSTRYIALTGLFGV